MLLENKNAIIYGAGGGVGTAVARAFAREGARLFLAGRTLAKLEAVAKEISASGGLAKTTKVNALNEREVERHVTAVVKQAGRIDVLFNAIGMEDIQGIPLVDMPVEDVIRPVMKAARTQFLTARTVARQMVKQRSGVIMTITAGPAREATAHIGGFGVACEAVEGLWRNFAAELGPHGVRLICVRSAGSPDTPGLQEVFGIDPGAGTKPNEALVECAGGTLLGRLPLVAEVANVAAMMASDRASAMTGTYVNVTCGSRVD
jgi:NAD(P)-dependent dehydrogenase (short-subunit alcohol dehydrogenase family)